MDPISWLLSFASDPWTYLPAFLLYAIATTVILPVPEEVGLLNPYIAWYLLVLVLALGKVIGAAMVYPFGERVERQVHRWVERFPALAPWYAWVQRGVGRFGYLALYAMLSVPFFTDTAPVYAFSMLNPQGPTRLQMAPFLLVNFCAGLTRGFLFLALPLYFGWS